MLDEVYSVSDITADIRESLEDRFNGVWVEGEISNHRLPASGHHYFTLKDSGAQLSCVLFRGAAMKSRIPLSDGMQVQAYGNISVYEARGQYQLIAQVVQPKGFGDLQAKFEALKRKLEAEGLFDPIRKKRIPSFPQRIGIVTSPTGAAIQDMINVLSRRAPWVEVMIQPVRVQGEGAAEEIAAGVRAFEIGAGIPRPDLIIVARGGGSIEDLWSFNEEVVARAIAEATVPVMSGVGHEMDFTIADFVADRREPTPSAAAENAVPDGESLMRHINLLQASLNGRVEGRIDNLSRQGGSLTARTAGSRAWSTDSVMGPIARLPGGAVGECRRSATSGGGIPTRGAGPVAGDNSAGEGNRPLCRASGLEFEAARIPCLIVVWKKPAASWNISMN